MNAHSTFSWIPNIIGRGISFQRMANKSAILSLNPVFEFRRKDSNPGPKNDWQKLSDLPEFITEGSEVKVTVAYPDDYKTVGLEIKYTNINDGEGSHGISKHHEGCFSCIYYKQSGSVEIISFEGSLIELAKKFGQGMEEAIEGMKLNQKRRIIIPPKVSCIGEYIFVDVTLMKIKESHRWPLKFFNSSSKL